jgi:hypothetical protein
MSRKTTFVEVHEQRLDGRLVTAIDSPISKSYQMRFNSELPIVIPKTIRAMTPLYPTTERARFSRLSGLLFHAGSNSTQDLETTLLQAREATPGADIVSSPKCC